MNLSRYDKFVDHSKLQPDGIKFWPRTKEGNVVGCEQFEVDKPEYN